MTSFVARLGGRGRRHAAVLLTTLVLTALTLLAPGRAAADQGWIFTATGTIRNVPTPQQFSVTVQTNGHFDVTLPERGAFPGSPTCSYMIRIVGDMVGQNASFIASATACTNEPPRPVRLLLNAPFPNATSGITPDSVVIPDLGVNVTISAQCSTSCPAPQPPLQVKQATEAAKQAAALGSVALTTTSVQTTNIGLRLAALRRGARGVNVSGVTFNLDGQPVPLDVVGSVITALGQGGGASADRTSAFGRLGVFLNGQGSFGKQDLTPRDAGFDFHTTGMTAGVDYRLTDQLVLGTAFGYLRTKTNLDASGGDSRVNGYSLSGYGSYYLENFYVDGIATFGRNEYRNERNVADLFTAQSHTDGTQLAVSVSTGYDVNVGALSAGPTARVNYVRVRIDGYHETGADIFNTRLSGQTIDSLTTALGGEARYAVSTGWGVFMPQLSFEWEHEYKGDSRTVVARVLGDPTVAAVRPGAPDRDYFNVGAGVTATFPGGISGFAHYQAVLGRLNFTSHAFTAGVRFAF